MKVERVIPLPLDKKQAVAYAAAAAEEQTGIPVKNAKYLGGGSFGRAVGLTYSDGQKIVVKLLRARGMMQKEVRDLGLLKKHCPERLPAVLFSRQSDDKIPVDCYGMERLEGKTAFMAFGMLLQSKSKRHAFADRVTSSLHAVHECKSPKFGDTLCPDCGSWLDYYRPFAREVLEKAEELYAQNLLSEKIVAVMRAAWEKFDLIFSEPVQEACLIHGDLNVGNIMVDKTYRITGFIDPLHSMYADREYDLFQFDNLTGKRFALRETYTRKYGASRFCEQKLAFYGLWNEVFCYIKAGVLVGFVMNPLVENMRRKLVEL